MGWHIRNTKNTVQVPPEAVPVLRDYFISMGYIRHGGVALVDRQGHLVFRQSDLEHMDYIANRQIQKILCDFNVEGDIAFTSTEGDNAGEAWGYRFDGAGGMKEVNGMREAAMNKVKITQGQLKRIIREEVRRIAEATIPGTGKRRSYNAERHWPGASYKNSGLSGTKRVRGMRDALVGADDEIDNVDFDERDMSNDEIFDTFAADADEWAARADDYDVLRHDSVTRR